MEKDMVARGDGQELDGDFGALDIEVLSGLDLSADNVIPPVLGVGAAAISSLLVRRFVPNAIVQDWSDAIGGVVGAALCMPTSETLSFVPLGLTARPKARSVFA